MYNTKHITFGLRLDGTASRCAGLNRKRRIKSHFSKLAELICIQSRVSQRSFVRSLLCHDLTRATNKLSYGLTWLFMDMDVVIIIFDRDPK